MEIQISGLTETMAMLENAPRLVVARGFYEALQAGINVIGAELAIRTPIDTADLVTAMTQAIILDAEFRGGEGLVGFGKQDYKAIWLEFGHRLVGHRPGKKVIGHVQANPFMRNTTDAAAEKAMQAFSDHLAAFVAAEYSQQAW